MAEAQRDNRQRETHANSAAQRLEGQAGPAESTASTRRGTRALQSAKTPRPARKRPLTLTPSLPRPHQAARAAVPVGALGPRTQRAVVGEAAGVRALLEPKRGRGTR